MLCFTTLTLNPTLTSNPKPTLTLTLKLYVDPPNRG